MSISASRRTRISILAVTGAASMLVPAAAHAAGAPSPACAKPVHLHLFAAAPAGDSNPDDITRIGDLVFTAYQNNAGSDGTPAGSKSDVVGYDLRTGKAEVHYVIPGRVDGLTADPRHHRVIATVNEDLNSSLYTITLGAHGGLKHYTYFPSPAQAGSDGTNGGTDSVAVAVDGTMYVAHSNSDVSLPGANNAPAVYTVKLQGSTARLTALFGVNDTAAVVDPAPGAAARAPMGLTDPDSNRWVPGRDGGTLIQDAQADSKLVFASDLDARKPTLRVLNLTNAVIPAGGDATTTPQLDDIVPAGGEGELFVVDQKAGKIYTADVRGFERGTLFAAQPAPKAGDLPNTAALAVVDTRTGVVTHLATDVPLLSPKGLVFVRADGDE